MGCEPDEIPGLGLEPMVIQKLRDVLKRFSDVEKGTVFGSRALKTYNTGSDIDLCLYGDNLTVKQLVEIRCRLDDLMLPYKIDTVIFHQIDNEELRGHIDRVGVKVY